jgi:hypothetical protein
MEAARQAIEVTGLFFKILNGTKALHLPHLPEQ